MNKEISMLYMRLGLNATATKLMISIFEGERSSKPVLPSDRSCRMYVNGEIQPKNGFNAFLVKLDEAVNQYAQGLLSKHKAGDRIRLVSYGNSDELWDKLWESDPDMYSVPVEFHNAVLNRIYLFGKAKGVDVFFVGADEPTSKMKTYHVSMPVAKLMKEFLGRRIDLAMEFVDR